MDFDSFAIIAANVIGYAIALLAFAIFIFGPTMRDVAEPHRNGLMNFLYWLIQYDKVAVIAFFGCALASIK
jgi:hypothetical protein